MSPKSDLARKAEFKKFHGQLTCVSPTEALCPVYFSDIEGSSSWPRFDPEPYSAACMAAMAGGVRNLEIEGLR